MSDKLNEPDAARGEVSPPSGSARWRFVCRAGGPLIVGVNGAWAVAPLASEWIHYAALAIKTQTPLAVLRDTVAQFPTFTEAYLNGLERLEP